MPLVCPCCRACDARPPARPAQTVILGTNTGGIGCVCVHPSRPVFAVCEKGHAPAVRIYEYPSLVSAGRRRRLSCVGGADRGGGAQAVLHELRGGAERAFSAAVFSPDGAHLATVAGDPDYSLTLWDWDKERTLLHAKAFSQEIFAVAFSPQHEGRLVTSGTGESGAAPAIALPQRVTRIRAAGHIRFWQLATTFTGLKLQGELGRFGGVDLSDISSFAQLPNGKVGGWVDRSVSRMGQRSHIATAQVLSGSESGHLILWDGTFIQCRIARADRTPCHAVRAQPTPHCGDWLSSSVRRA